MTIIREVEVEADDPHEAERIGVDLADRKSVVDVSVQQIPGDVDPTIRYLIGEA